MTTSSEPTPELSTQVLPTVPTVKEMKTWDKEKVLRWIQQRDGGALEGDDLEKFKKEDISGMIFLASSLKFFRRDCRLSAGANMALRILRDEVRGGKIIPWM